jgi:hypothetical protein
VRVAQETAYRFMSTMAGNEPGFEEAARALFAREDARFTALIEAWPADVRNHLNTLAQPAMQETSADADAAQKPDTGSRARL